MKKFKDLERIIIMKEWSNSVSLMNNEQKGILLQAIFDFADCKDINIEDPMVNLVWSMIQPNMDRMNRNYLARVNNGKKGGAPIGNTNNRKKPKVNLSQPKVNHSQVEVNLKSTDKEKKRKENKGKEEIEIRNNGNYSIAINEKLTRSGKVVTKDEKRRVEELSTDKSDLLSSMFSNINNLEITENETV
tara:strand:+ start:48 stop:614 length:567 start_codon:yes stop_codon:yes gene_type:complete